MEKAQEIVEDIQTLTSGIYRSHIDKFTCTHACTHTYSTHTQTLKIKMNPHIFYMYLLICTCKCTCAMACLCQSVDNRKGWCSASTTWTPGSELKSSGLTSRVAPAGHTVSLALNPHILNQRPRADKMPQIMALKLCFLSLWNHWGTSLRKVWV